MKNVLCASMRRYFMTPDKLKSSIAVFFAFSYVIPLLAVCILYSSMLHRLLYGNTPSGKQSKESLHSKKRVTHMVVMVVIVFALCWLPINIILMIQYFGSYPESIAFVGLQIASNCLAYLNSCLNPFLYAFLSENFRKSFKKLLCCCKKAQSVHPYRERSNAQALESMGKGTRTTPLKYNDTENNDKHISG